jgi:hypothetical protein
MAGLRIAAQDCDEAFRVRSLSETQRDTLRALLAAENERWNGVSQTVLFADGGVVQPSEAGTTLSIILREEMAGSKKRHLDELSQAAVKRGYPFGDKAPGRVVHFALLGMKSGNLVEQLGEGYWRLSQQH